jgi:hypothetical protein
MSVQSDYYIPALKKADEQISLQAAEITRLHEAAKGQLVVVNAANARAEQAEQALRVAREAAKDEIGWLIEPNEQWTQTLYLSLDRKVLGFWTNDHNLATRFGRKIDAENWLASQDSIDPAKVHPVEHMWSDPSADECKCDKRVGGKCVWPQCVSSYLGE